MKNQILNRSIATIFLAPDDGGGAGAATLDVPTITAPAPTVTEVNLPTNGIEKMSAVKSLGLPEPEDTGIRGPAAIFGEDQSPEAVTRELEKGLKNKTPERDAEGKFLPKDGKKAETKQPVKQPEQKQPEAKKAEPVKPAIEQKPTEPAKIKIGNEEKTAEEWEKHYAELRQKAEAQQQAKDDKPAETEQTKEADPQERERAFIERASKEYGITEDALDTILSGGKDAVKMVAELHAKSEMRSRQYTAEVVSQIMDDIAPIIEQRQLIAQYQEERTFLTGNPDIAQHAEGLATYRKVANQMETGYQDIQQRAAAGKATPQEKLWAEAYANLKASDPEQFKKDLAYYTREALKLPATGAQPQQAAQQQQPKPEAKKPVERPLSGDRPGGASAPKTETAEQRLAREMNEGL